MEFGTSMGGKRERAHGLTYREVPQELSLVLFQRCVVNLLQPIDRVDALGTQQRGVFRPHAANC